MAFPQSDHADQRASWRHSFRSTPFTVRAASRSCEFRLKDLSCGGASGLMSEPVDVGEFIIVEFDSRHHVEAEICWVRRFLVGLRFTHPLSPRFLDRLLEKHAGDRVAR